MIVQLGTFVSLSLCRNFSFDIYQSASLLSVWKSGWRKSPALRENNEYKKTDEMTRKKHIMFTGDIIHPCFYCKRD